MLTAIKNLSILAILALVGCGGGGSGSTAATGACTRSPVLTLGYIDPRVPTSGGSTTSFSGLLTFATLEKVEFRPSLGFTCGAKTNFGFSSGSASSLAGLTINKDTGVISGIPTISGTKNFTVSVSAEGYTGTATLNMQFIVDDYGLTYASSTNVTTVGSSVSLLPNLTDGLSILPTPGIPIPLQGQSNSSRGSFLPAGSTLVYSLLSGALPPGLTLNPSTGLISGVPTTTGTFDLSVTLDATFEGATLRAANSPIQSLRITVN